VYARRREILEGEDLREDTMHWIEDVIEAAVDSHAGGAYGEEWDWDGLWVAVNSVYPTRVDQSSIDRATITRDELLDLLFDDAVRHYEAREQQWGAELARAVERWISLQVLDTRWREHLDNMDYMRQGIGLRGYAQKDPLVEYKSEGLRMFEEMNFQVKQEVVRGLMHAEVHVEDSPRYEAPRQADGGGYRYEHDATSDLQQLAAGVAPDDAAAAEAEGGDPFHVEQRRVDPSHDVGRNDPCWCGSGKKYKKCHGA
jgi:preprotein translocase subunit SecA